MNINLVTCLFVIDTQKSENNKKNDIKVLKILVKKTDKSLPNIYFKEQDDMKTELKDYITKIINTKTFHLEQVYTLAERKYFADKKLDIIYLSLANIENIKNIDEHYELIPIKLKTNEYCQLGETTIKYKTKELKNNGNIEYIHEIETEDINLEKQIMEIIIAYKHLKNRIDNTDAIFKLLPQKFSLEDTRIIYELITETKVDKSNFRKRIIKYCEKTNEIIKDKAYRPTIMYKYNLTDKIWL